MLISMVPIAHYKLNGDCNDSSGNGAHGTPTAISYVAGKIGQAGGFNGSTSKGAVNLNVASAAFSISLCFFDAAIGTNTKEHLFSKWKADASKRSFMLSLCQGYTGNVAFGVSDLGTNYLIKKTANSIYSAGAWHHLVATYDAGVMSLYLDGVEVSISTYSSSGAAPTGAPNSNDAELWIGGAEYESGGAKYFGGLLDDVRLYDGEALPLWKIKALYNGGAGSEEESGSPALTQHQTLAVGDAECIVESQNVVLNVYCGTTIFAQQSLFMAT